AMVVIHKVTLWGRSVAYRKAKSGLGGAAARAGRDGRKREKISGWRKHRVLDSAAAGHFGAQCWRRTQVGEVVDEEALARRAGRGASNRASLEDHRVNGATLVEGGRAGPSA